jgi:hypothetical protein
MEKARMNKEKEGLLRRLHSIDARLDDMEAEKCALLETIDRPPAKSRYSGINGGGEDVSAVPGGFRLRY